MTGVISHAPHVLLAALGLGLVTAGASADVTLTGATRSEGSGLAIEGDSRVSVKGLAMRSDVTVRGETSSTIVDLARRRFVALDHAARQAIVYDLGEYAEDLRAVADRDVTVVLTPTGRTREQLSQPCQEHVVEVRVAGAPGRAALAIDGRAWIAAASAAREDWARFHEAAAASRLFFTDPRVARSNPARAKAMTALYRQIASVGVPYAIELEVAVRGEGASADIARRAGTMTMRSRLVAIDQRPLDAALFDVPAAYSVTRP